MFVYMFIILLTNKDFKFTALQVYSKNQFLSVGCWGAKSTFSQHLHHSKNKNKKNGTHHILQLFYGSEMHQK